MSGSEKSIRGKQTAENESSKEKKRSIRRSETDDSIEILPPNNCALCIFYWGNCWNPYVTDKYYEYIKNSFLCCPFRDDMAELSFNTPPIYRTINLKRKILVKRGRNLNIQHVEVMTGKIFNELLQRVLKKKMKNNG